jgi:CBS domain-containing protein
MATTTKSRPAAQAGLKAKDIMVRPVIAVTRKTTVRDLAIQMFLGGFTGMPVAERGGDMVGIVTEFDIIRAIRAGKSVETTTAEDIMTKDVISVDIEASVDEVMDIMETAHVLRVPVTSKGRLVGLVARPDVLRAFVEPNFMEFS